MRPRCVANCLFELFERYADDLGPSGFWKPSFAQEIHERIDPYVQRPIESDRVHTDILDCPFCHALRADKCGLAPCKASRTGCFRFLGSLGESMIERLARGITPTDRKPIGSLFVEEKLHDRGETIPLGLQPSGCSL